MKNCLHNDVVINLKPLSSNGREQDMTNIHSVPYKTCPSKRGTLIRCWFNVGPPSATLAGNQLPLNQIVSCFMGGEVVTGFQIRRKDRQSTPSRA